MYTVMAGSKRIWNNGALDLDAVISAAHHLHPLPASLTRLAILVADNDTDLRAIVEVISFDQALTGALLARANSAASAGRQAIRTVHEAVVRLGTGTVLAMAMSASVSGLMRSALPTYGLAEGQLWRHSVRTALAAEVVKREAKMAVGAEVSTAALLHDLGKLILARHCDSDVDRAVLQAMEHDGLDRLDAETLVLGVNHAELSALIVQSWGLPDGVVKAVQYHHHPDLADTGEAHIVRLANDLSHDLEGDHGHSRTTWRDSMTVVGLRVTSWPDLMRVVEERYEALAARYG
jgi:putative nucleotidyltransferase with HDIG domain